MYARPVSLRWGAISNRIATHFQPKPNTESSTNRRCGEMTCLQLPVSFRHIHFDKVYLAKNWLPCPPACLYRSGLLYVTTSMISDDVDIIELVSSEVKIKTFNRHHRQSHFEQGLESDLLVAWMSSQAMQIIEASDQYSTLLPCTTLSSHHHLWATLWSSW